MKTLRYVVITALGAVLVVAACSKSAESKETKPEIAAGQAPAVAPSAGPGTPQDKPLKAPTVAIGETKTRLLAMSSKKLAETAEYILTVETPDDVAAGKAGRVRVLLAPKNGWKLNKEFPTKLTVAAPSGVTIDKAKQGVADAVKFEEKGGAEWSVDFTSASDGKKEFGGKFRFAVCTELTCDPKKEKLAFVVNVK